MMALHAKDYYVAPIYPVLFAAGGIAWGRRCSRTAARPQDRISAFPVLESSLILIGACHSAWRSRPEPEHGSTTPSPLHLDKASTTRRTRPTAPSRSSTPTASAGRRRSIRSPASTLALARRPGQSRHSLLQLRRGQRHQLPRPRPAHRHQRPQQLLALGTARRNRRSHDRHQRRDARRDAQVSTTRSRSPDAWTTPTPCPTSTATSTSCRGRHKNILDDWLSFKHYI